MTSEESQHLQTLLQIHHRNLRHLELQAAQHGALNTDINLINAIENEKHQIHDIEARLQDKTVVKSVLPLLHFEYRPIGMLYILSGHKPGTTFFVTEEQRSITFGRGNKELGESTSDIVIPSKALSRPHFQVRFEPIEANEINSFGYIFHIRDLASANGTILSEKRLSPQADYQLKDQDVSRCGGVQIKFVQLKV